ncbi:SDR family NAD(P)-dependent oxidoreductase [Streptomyces syringium]|uniref:SDR family NAD(P)-dependent oxidoreductase n=1 Tax=Streptomyces syringium TaxID=76729 RepID=UPI0034545B6B
MQSVSSGAVALVGVGLRLPGGIASLDGLWLALIENRDLVSDTPPDRFDRGVFGDPAGRAGKAYTTAGGFLEDIAAFDAAFFGMSPKEASRVDPQHRLVLECTVEALGDAAIDPQALAGSDAGVFMGVSTHDYGDLQMQRPKGYNAYTMAGAATCNVANRVSYFFDLHGPSLAIDTACSSTLTAVHEACEAVRSGRSAVALAGGVNVMLSPFGFLGGSVASMLSPTGRCHPFSALADGFVRAEGAGVFVLKSLAAALADGDRVHGVIAGSAANSDGRTAGLSMPSPQAQRQLLERVYEASGVNPGDVSYVEAHGTGTRAGDPVECAALGAVLGRGRSLPLPVGSVKSNVGHLEAGAGVAGLAKALLVLREGVVPKTLHSQPVSEEIDFTGLGLAPVLEPVELEGPRVVGVNSFGFGGANAHVVVVAPEPAETKADGPGAVPVMVSGHSEAALVQAAGEMADFLSGPGAPEFKDAAYSSVRRGGQGHRCVVFADDPAMAASRLRTLATGEKTAAAAAGKTVAAGRVGFVFSGNGSVWEGMGTSLLASDPVFAAEIDEIDVLLGPLLGWSVREELEHPSGPEHWDLTEVAQPLLFALQAGVVASLKARGVVPHGVVGHSVGEVAAAFVAGWLDRGQACRVIAARSRLQAATRGAGRMAAVGLGQQETLERLADSPYAGDVLVTAVNTERDVTVGGSQKALAAWGEELLEEGVFFRDIGLEYAFHHPVTDTIEGPLREELADLGAAPGEVPMFSSVTGGGVDEGLTAGHWWRNIREPVQFSAAVEGLLGSGVDVLVEIGPRPVLSGYLRRITAGRDSEAALVTTLTRSAAGAEAIEGAVAHLLAIGAEVDTRGYFPAGKQRVVSLPAYAWQREPHWHGEASWWLSETSADGPQGARHPLLGSRRRGATPVWQQSVEPGSHGWLADHKVGAATIMPAAAFVEMALSAGQSVFDAPVEIARLTLDAALVLPVDQADPDLVLHTQLDERDGRFSVSGRRGGDTTWTEHVHARVRPLLRAAPAVVDAGAVRQRMSRQVSHEEHYALCAEVGLIYGPAFQTVHDLATGQGEACAAFTTPDGGGGWQVHPAVLDGALQTGIFMALGGDEERVPYLPAGIDAVCCWRPVPAAGFIHVRQRARSTAELRWDVTLTDADGAVALEATGLRLRRFEAGAAPRAPHMEEVWRALPLEGTGAEVSPLPSPSQVLAQAGQGLEALARDFRAFRYAVYQPRALDLLAQFTVAAVCELLPEEEQFTLEDLHAAGVRPVYSRLMTVLLDAACAQGWLEKQDTQWRCRGVAQPEEAFRAMVADFPAESAQLHAYGVCGRHLVPVLRGEQDPLELLFSQNDELAARVYDSMPVLIYHNHIARQLLRTAISGWPQGRPLRVLEVGAGTGSITRTLLPELPAGNTRYTYTDISPAFFQAAEEKFAAFDFIDYRRLDLDADPGTQGFAEGSFDVVVASNVLHATKDLAATMRRISTLLADGGHLIALEIHTLAVFATIFGLLDSFWASADTALRPVSPLLSQPQWTELLRMCDFGEVAYGRDEQEPARSDVSAIIASRAPRTMPQPKVPVDVSALPQRWLIATVGSEVSEPGTALTAQLPGISCMVPQAQDPASWQAALPAGEGPVGLVLLAGANHATGNPADLTDQAVQYCTALHALAHTTEQIPDAHEVHAWVIFTTDAHRPEEALDDAPGAALWGACRALANEQPRIGLRRIAWNGPAGALVAEMASGSAEDEVVLTPAGRYVPRVRTHSRRPVPSHGENLPFAVQLRNVGPRYRLEWQPITVTPPGRGEILISTRATALNYRDVLTGLGLTPMVADYAQKWRGQAVIGIECAGVVLAVGDDVTTVKAGDRVMAPAAHSFASHTVARADRAIILPEAMTCAEAATMPVAFYTVLHSLGHLAGLRQGEILLVHGAAGGVGLAAVQYARTIGARVIGTAGTEAKRDLLRLLGVDDVLDSRSLHFAHQVRELTGGRGVDVVLNSVAGDALTRSMEILAPYGRFIELGKRDVTEDNPLPMAPFSANISFHAVDISTLLINDSPLADHYRDLLDEAVHTGTYRPLLHRTYPAARIQDAFTALQYSRHHGKIVVTFDEAVPVTLLEQAPVLRPDAAYLVTGGLGGFGAATARHLAGRGARHLALLGRRGINGPGAPELVADLTAQGIAVSVHAVDVTDRAALVQIIDTIQQGPVPLAGLVHAAMVLDDAKMVDFSTERIRATLAPKMLGGLLLDELTRSLGLDFFVTYSSAATIIGNTYQAAYHAGNTVLDVLAGRRRRAGLPALSVQWGVIEDVGYAHRQGIVTALDDLGLGRLTSYQALHALDRLMTDSSAEVVSVADAQWNRLVMTLPALVAPRTGHLISEDSATADGREDRFPLKGKTADESVAFVEEKLAELLAAIMQTTPDRIPTDARLDRLGADSLMATELAVQIRQRLGCDIAALELINAPGLHVIAQRIATKTAGGSR